MFFIKIIPERVINTPYANRLIIANNQKDIKFLG